MATQNLPTSPSGLQVASEIGAENQSPSSYLSQEYENWLTLFTVQPILTQRFYDAQARQIADALLNNPVRLHFSLPDRVVTQPGQTTPIPTSQREQAIGDLWQRVRGVAISVLLRHWLDQLEALADTGGDQGLATAAGLLRFATSHYMISELLPAGRPVTYAAEVDEEIPSIPVTDDHMLNSAITAPGDAIVEEHQEENEQQERGELLVPYVPAARRFYLPQWVAFDENDQLLVGSVEEALAYIDSMKRFLRILHSAVALAPYMVADETYQRKRYGMLGQFVNQGRALARFQTRQIIATIQRRAAGQNLNRGLSISLPYLDDQDLAMKIYPFQIIPSGRIMFVPAFVVRAARQEQVKVAQDTRLSPSTRKHLIYSLELLEAAFHTHI